MSHARGLPGSALLLGLACLLGLAAAAWAVLDGTEAEREASQARVAARLDAHLRAEVRALEALANRVSDAWMQADLASEDAIDSQSAMERAWQALVRLHPAAGQALVAVYVEPEEEQDKDWVLAGLIADARVHADPQVLRTDPRRLPTSIARAELLAAQEPADALALVWLSPGNPGVRLNAVITHIHVFEEEDEATADVIEEMLLVHLQVPFAPPDPQWVRLRCDVSDGQLDPAPEWQALDPAAADLSGPLRPALDPDMFRFRFPQEALGPRAQVGSDPRPALGPLALAGAALLALLTVLCLALLRRGATGVAPPELGAEAAHELRTPLTVMRGTIEVALRRERPASEYRQTLSQLLEEVKGMQAIQESVLLLQRGASMQTARESVDLADLVNAEAERLRDSHPERAVEVSGTTEPVLLQGDPSLLARAIGNLLDNAALHSVAGGSVRITLERRAGHAEVRVQDDGPGIPAARLEQVFARFYRGPEVGQRGIPGAGLGLAIVRWIAEAHGGRAYADPSAQGFARMVLRLPLP